MFTVNRKSHAELGEIHFCIATIHKWNHLLKPDEMEDLAIASLEYLSNARNTDIFSFLIMPDHPDK